MMERNASARLERDAQSAQAEWLGAMQSLAEQIQKQQQLSQKMTQELMNTYMQLLNTPGSYISGQAEQQQTLQQTAQEVMSTYSELFNIPISYAKEGLRDAQFPIEGYEELTVEEVSGRLGALSTEELREVRDYEEHQEPRHYPGAVRSQDKGWLLGSEPLNRPGLRQLLKTPCLRSSQNYPSTHSGE